MPRQLAVRRQAGKVVVVLNNIVHTISEPAFIELMHAGLGVLEAITHQRAEQQKGETA
jgi:hypothetical protein